MKIIFKTILKYYLKYITKLVLFIHHPTIIAVAGSTNKTFVKDEIKKVLREKGINVRANPNNFNTEIGLPLAVLNLPSGYNEYKKWLPCLYHSIFCLFQKDFPRVLVLELGASNRGDMKHLLSIIKPKISVITDITQRYLDNFSDMNDLVDEYKLLAARTKHNGLVVLNYDNIRLRKMFQDIRTQKQSFGQSLGSDWKAFNIQRTEKGERFSVEHNNKSWEKEISRFGQHHIYATLTSLIIKEYLFNE
jgi:UDP-N-acetylmuramoyl-tripeptide--D-alanyl-D-alanine ligase